MPVKTALLLCLSLTIAVRANSNTPSSVAQVEARYHSARTLQASFLERYLENGRVVRVEAGVAYFRKPGRMRWNYESPEKSEFVVDGKTAWFYVPSDRTVTRVPAKKSEDWRTPLSLLAGEIKLSKLCSRINPAPKQRPLNIGGEVLACTLRSSSGSASPSEKAKDSAEPGTVFIEISPQFAELSRIVVSDPGGSSIEFQFRNWQFNPALPEALFRFAPPPGVAIVNGELPTRYSGVNP
jgi:outer membrane lipoprotein carrier protein